MIFKTVLILFFLNYSLQYGSIDYELPTKLSVLNYGLSSIYTFTLKFQTSLLSNDYLMVNFTNYTSAIIPKSCFYSIYPIFPNTVTTCSVPNSDNVLFILLPIAISNANAYTFVVELVNLNPISSLGSAIELKSVSSTDISTFVVYDYNPNFESIPFNVSCSNILSTRLLGFDNELTRNMPSQQVNIYISIKINVDVIGNPKIKLVLTNPWSFATTTILTVSNDPKYIALSDNDTTKSEFKSPALKSFQIESPLEASMIFAESLTKGRSFQININSFINPPTFSTIFLKVYTMNYNSNSAVEVSENSIQLQTLQNTLSVSLGLASKIPIIPNTAAGFYKDSQQYIQVNITSTNPTPDNSYLTVIIGNSNSIIKGSVTLSGILAFNGSIPIALTYSSNTLQISNIKSITSKSLVSVTMRIKTSAVDSYISANASFDVSGTTTTPSFSGTSSVYYFQSNAYSIVSSLSLSMSPTNTLIIALTPSVDDTNSNSFLEIYLSRFIKFSGSPTCSINILGTITSLTCTLVNSGNYYYLKVLSISGANYFPSSGETLTITGFTLTDCSNHQDKIYEFYFALNSDNSATAAKLFFMIPTLALPTRNAFSNFYQSYSNDLTWTTFNYNYPSILNLVGTSTDFSTITVSSGSQRVITVFAYKGLTNLFGTNLISNSSYPCGSNLLITCVYIQGDSQTSVSSTYFLDWDRVHIYLPSTISQDFHIILPDIFQSANYVYEFYFGTVSSTNQFTYSYLETQLSFTPFRTFSASLLNTNIQIQNSGFAAAEISNFMLNIYSSTSQLGNLSPNFGAGLFIITSWELWVSGVSSVSVGTAFGTLQNAPVTFDFFGGDNQHYYVLCLPLTNSANLNAGLVSYLNGVFNPFSLDLPNYVIYVTRKTSEFDAYNAFFNAGTNSYSSNNLKSLTYTCTDMLDSEKNTFCTLTFQPNNRLAANGNLLIQATGLTFNTNACTLSYVKGSTVYNVSGYSCQVMDSAKTIMNVGLSLSSALNVLNVAYFNISFYGVDIDTSGNGSVLIDFSVRDFSSNYVVEGLVKSFSVSPKLLRFHTIKSIYLEYYNPNSVTQMNITVSFPRDLYPNENFGLDLGSDLYEKNQNPEEIRVEFYNYATMLQYLVSVKFSGSLIILTLSKSGDSIKAGTYFFWIKGVKIPSKTPQTPLMSFYLRSFDQMVTLQSFSNSTANFPALISNNQPNIQILEAKYILEDHIAEYVFNVNILSSSLDYTTIIYLNFPEYYSPSLYSDSSLLYCGIDNLNVSCSNDLLFPYRLKLTNFPAFYYEGSNFNITIYGILSPKYSNRNLGKYINSSIVFGIDQFKNGSFSEMANLLPPSINPVANPFNYLSLLAMVAENLFNKDFSNHNFELLLQNMAIPQNAGFLLNFGEEYDSIRNLETIQCRVSYIASNGSTIIVSSINSCSVRGRRVKGYFNQSIPASTAFNISLFTLPTPKCYCTIDPNLMLISIFDPTELTIISYTKYQLNSAPPLIFLNKLEDINLNNGDSIVLTQGTYSPVMAIAPSGGSRFLNNMMLNVTLDGFSFLPSTLQIMLGDFSSAFQIGVERDLLNGIYSFSFQKKEFGFKDIYKSLATVYLFLTTNPIRIDVPANLIVNYYGCNLPFIVNLTSPPFSSLIMNFMLDYDTFGETFYVDDQLNSYAAIFMQNNTLSNLAFCTNSLIDTSIPSTVIYLSLTGINPGAYYISNSQINVVFQNKTRVNPPGINSTINYIGRTEVSISLNVNCDGLVFYRLSNRAFNQKNLTSTEIREFMQSRNFTQWVNNTNPDKDGVNEKINYMIIYNNTVDTTINNTLIIDGLTPSKEYEFFAYARNEFRDMSDNFTYLRFTTQVLQNLTKILVIYNRSIYGDESNNFYCYMVREFQTRSKLMVSSEGTSCSFNFNPTSNYFNYSGQTFSASTNRTNLYFIPDAELEHDVTHDLILQSYDPTTNIFSQNVTDEGLNFGVDYVNEMIFMSSFNQSLLYNGNSPFSIPSLINVSFGVYDSKYNSSILVKNLTLSGDGAVYFIMEPYLKTLEDSDFPGEYYNETIVTYQKPTGDQIKNCKNYLNETAPVCFRAIYYNFTGYDIEIRALENYTVYKVYYIIANENPIFPVYNNSQVFEAEALSYTIFSVRLGFKNIYEWILIGILLLVVFGFNI